MCGIAVVLPNNCALSDKVIERMTHALIHRGPDAQRCVRLNECHLGHTRLSIIDLFGGDQPMSDETGRYWIVFNGEIFNYRELRGKLEKDGLHFRTQSDTEVLLRAYQRLGDDVVNHLNGQFAFAIWDQTAQSLFAARDRMGEKPLFWSQTLDGQILFASEIKALLASELIEPRIDSVAVDAYLGLLYVPPDRTIYSNIFPLRPAHALSWRNGCLKQWAYWQPRYSQANIDDPKAIVEELRFLVKQAVRRQMVADVPVGAFLSGGLDSSTIVALMAQNTSHSIASFSVGFGDLIDELPYARLVAEAYKTQHHELHMDIPVGEMLERMADVYDEPFADSSNIPTYLVAKFARQHVKVVLSGDGADEIFGGYEWYRPLLNDGEIDARAASRAVLWLHALLLRFLGRTGLPFEQQKNAAVLAHYRAALKRRYPDLWERHLANSTTLKRSRQPFWNGRTLPATEISLHSTYCPPAGCEGLDRAVDFDVRCYLPGDILVKVDRAAMAHGLETRAPFLDVDLVEFVLNLAAEFRFSDSSLKYLLRQSCSNLWPEKVRTRPKQGFGAPIWNWLQRRDVRALVQRVAAPSHPLNTLLPGAPLISESSDPQLSWTLLCLGLWLEKRATCLNNLS